MGKTLQQDTKIYFFRIKAGDIMEKTAKMDFLGKKYLLNAIILILLIELILITLSLTPFVKTSFEINATLFTTIPLFILTIMQLAKTYRVQRAQYVKDFLMEFRRNKEISDSYYQLIYSYKDETYEKIKEIAKSQEEPTSSEKPVFEIFKHLQGNRKVGERYYYPKFFHFSEEERKLDGVLDFFNTLSYYWSEGLVSMEEIANTLGEYLVVISQRKVIKEYLDYCNNTEESKYKERFESTSAYLYLVRFLEEFINFNSEHKRKIKIKELQNAIIDLRKRRN